MATALLASLEPGGALARVLGSYENRPSQRSMANAIADAIADQRPLLVEAGTGTGKTLAYLLPALASGKRVIISTGTRALQEQLATKDVELLRRVSGAAVRVAVLKGVSNYVCRRRLADTIAQTDLLADVDDQLARALPWLARTDSGDRSELGEVPEDAALWKRITTAADGRLGSECPHIDSCFVAGARRAAERADLIIVNHHLFFTDFALRRRRPGARVLPDYDAVIFDEAHQLEDIIASHLGPSVSSRGVAALATDLRRPDRGWQETRCLEWMETCAQRFFAEVAAKVDRESGGRIEMPEQLFAHEAVEGAWLRLDAALDDVARAADHRASVMTADGEEEATVTASGLRAAALRADEFRDALASIAEPSSPACGQWIERQSGEHGESLRLCAAPGSAAEIIAEVIAETPATVFTSATLTTESSFAFVRDRLGLGGETDELALESPFDYQQQALLYVPRDLPEPGDPAFAAGACQRVAELLAMTPGGAFLLFTSWRALHEATRLLPSHPQMGDRLLLVQGEAPKAALLDRFRAAGDAVLLATASFWQGVDVSGDALSLVVIDKLPFAVPSDPLHRARCKQLEERGLDAFAGYQLPAAALQLKQGFGRLIRSRSDRGVAAILDPRAVSRRYGRTFLDTLPTALPRTSVLEQVRRFWSREC